MKHYITDIETGTLIEVTEEQKRRYVDMVNSIQPILKPEYKGMISIFGTGGNTETGGLEKIFINPISSCHSQTSNEKH